MAEGALSDEQLAKAADCRTPEDLYRQAARELIARSCRSFLEMEKLTPTEVLLSAKAQRRLSDFGTTYSGAVQKAAIGQVAGTKKPVSERIRELYKVCDDLHARTRAALEGFEPPKLTPASLPELLLALEALPDDQVKMIRLGASIAETLTGLKAWPDRLSTLLGLLAACPPARQRLFDQVLGEMLRAPDALKACLGEAPTPAEQIQRLSALFLGEATAASAPAEPALARDFYAVMADRELPEARDALLAHLMHAIGGSGSLSGRSGDREGELAATVALREKLTRDGKIVGGALAEAAFDAREFRLVNEHNVDEWTLRGKTVPEKVRLALELWRRLSGDKARGAVRGHLDFLLQERPVEGWLVAPGTGVVQQAQAVAAVHREISAAPLPDVFKGKLTTRLEGVQERLLAESELLAKLEKRAKSSAEAALTLLDLVGNGTFIRGPSLDQARRSLDRLLKKPDFLASYLQGAADDEDRKRRAIALQQKLRAAGIG